MPLSMQAHEALAARGGEVISRWKDAVRGALVPEAMPPMELVDAMPAFLDEIVAALRERARRHEPEPHAGSVTTAREHGSQRLRLGFSLEEVVHEYGALESAVTATLLDAGVALDLADLRVVFETIVEGIAQAVSQYVAQRDAELARQANEHFAFVAHELRNPLATSMAALRLLQMRGELPADSRAAQALQRGLQRTATLVDETLATARTLSGIELRRTPATLRELLDVAAAEATPEAEEKGVAIHVSAEGDRRLEVDERLIRSALGNLLRNAVEYTPSGTVELRGRASDTGVTFEVEDHCGGLPPGKVEEAFTPFVRLRQDSGGFGLGLAITKQAAEAHGGSVRVKNVPGTGCIFVLELPAAALQAASTASP